MTDSTAEGAGASAGDPEPGDWLLLRERLREAEETLQAIRCAEVDALVVEGPVGQQIYTLKGADEPYRLIVEQMQEGALTLAPTGTVLYCNMRFSHLLKTPLEKIVGGDVWRFLDDAGVDRFAELLREGVISGSDEFLLRAADGDAIPVLITISELRGMDARGFCCVVTDLSQQKRAEESIRAEQLATSIIEHATEAILVCNREQTITHASRLAKVLRGDGIIGLPLDAVFPVQSDAVTPASSMRAGVSNYIATALEGELVQGREIEVIDVTGRDRPMLLSCGPLRTGANTVGCVIALTDISERKAIEQRQQMLVAELNHRVKNTLAAVQSIAVQTLRYSPVPRDFEAAFTARLLALSEAHGLLAATNWEGAEMRELAISALRPFAGGGREPVLSGGPLRLAPRTAVALGMVLHEFATNAAKYGALSSERGRVELQWRVEDDGECPRAVIHWSETGGPHPEPTLRKGFGITFVERSLSYELNGSARVAVEPTGLRWTLDFPLAPCRCRTCSIAPSRNLTSTG